MIKIINKIRLRSDIAKMEDLIQMVGGYPTPETREQIVELINKVCVHQVTDRTTPEDIDNGEFRYGIQPTHVQEEIKVRFMYQTKTKMSKEININWWAKDDWYFIPTLNLHLKYRTFSFYFLKFTLELAY